MLAEAMARDEEPTMLRFKRIQLRLARYAQTSDPRALAAARSALTEVESLAPDHPLLTVVQTWLREAETGTSPRRSPP